MTEPRPRPIGGAVAPPDAGSRRALGVRLSRRGDSRRVDRRSAQRAGARVCRDARLGLRTLSGDAGGHGPDDAGAAAEAGVTASQVAHDAQPGPCGRCRRRAVVCGRPETAAVTSRRQHESRSSGSPASRRNARSRRRAAARRARERCLSRMPEPSTRRLPRSATAQDETRRRVTCRQSKPHAALSRSARSALGADKKMANAELAKAKPAQRTKG